MVLMLLVLCLGVVAVAFQQKSVFDRSANGAAAEAASSVSVSQKENASSASQKTRDTFSFGSAAKYAQHTVFTGLQQQDLRHSVFPDLRQWASQTGNRAPSVGVDSPDRGVKHAVNNANFNVTYPLTYDANGGTETSAAKTFSPKTLSTRTVSAKTLQGGTLPAKMEAGNGAQACSSQHASGETITLPTGSAGDYQVNEPTRDGMKFVGWSTTKLAPFDTLSDAEAHVVGTLTMPESSQTMYAVWVRDGETPTSYTVTFNTQMDSHGIAGSAITLKTDTVSPGGTSTPPTPPVPYNQGIKFMGWGVSKDSGDASGEGEMNAFDSSAPINSNETVWALWGYEDTLDGNDHKCVMGIDTVATCFPDPVLAQTVVDAAQATDAHQTTDIWTLRDALFFGNLNYNTAQGHELDDTPLNISELDGLQTLTGLGRLHISNVSGHTLNEHSRDLHQLKYLGKMNNLFANGDGISDLGNLSGLTNLTTLYLADNSISDLSSLSGLSDLQTLNMNNNGIADVSNLSGLTLLTTLYLDHNQISDLSGLISTPTVELTNLKELDLNDNRIVDVRPLAKLTTLSTLKLQHNQIESITSLTSLTGIYALYLDNNNIKDISVIDDAHFHWLGILGLSHNGISDISSLRDVTSLKQLWLHHNDISDVSPLAGLTKLEMLYIGSNHILDISSLKNLAALSGGTSKSCDVGSSSFCADKQDVTLPQGIADPGLSMLTAVTLKKAADGSVAGAAVDSTSIHSTTPGARFDAEHRQLTWDGPMQYNNDDSPKDLTQTFDADAQLPNTIGNFSGTITEPYAVAQHTVTFDPDGGTLPSGQLPSVQVYSGYKIAVPTSKPSRDGYRFMSWTCAADVAGVCHAGDSFDFVNTAVTKDVTLAAKWQELAVALPLTGASYRDDLWRGALAVIALCVALASGLLRKRAAGR